MMSSSADTYKVLGDDNKVHAYIDSLYEEESI